MPPLTLHPVIEFDPFEYRVDAATRPAPDRDASAESWSEFWAGSLADRGIRGLRPWPGTWVVPVAQLLPEPDVLARVVTVHFGEDSIVAFFDNLPGPFDPKSGLDADGESIESHCEPLRGGIGMSSGTERIAPECCGDLGNWRNWENAARVETAHWQDLWIGHPAARVCRIDGVLCVQKVLESGEPDGPTITTMPENLSTAATAAKRQLEQLASALESVLRCPGVDPQLTVRVARRLAGLAEFELD